MADSFRLRVLKALCAELATITKATGYNHDIAAVARGRLTFSEAAGDVTPMLSIVEPPKVQMLDATNDLKTKGRWPLTLQGWVDNDLTNPTDAAHNLCADVMACLSKVAMNRQRDGLLLGKTSVNRVSAMHLGNPIVRPPDAGVSDTAYFVLPLELQLVEDWAQPFA